MLTIKSELKMLTEKSDLCCPQLTPLESKMKFLQGLSGKMKLRNTFQHYTSLQKGKPRFSTTHPVGATLTTSAKFYNYVIDYHVNNPCRNHELLEIMVCSREYMLNFRIVTHIES